MNNKHICATVNYTQTKDEGVCQKCDALWKPVRRLCGYTVSQCIILGQSVTVDKVYCILSVNRLDYTLLAKDNKLRLLQIR